ncbi:hypothetical protein HNQ81_001250 [Desulfoprunum benzoelyticum]|uniref:Ice-binding protein C-terminal domain-containing protein n=1 Tax=Desulfoprunum benzoelyticum TaxID=1506996 RepID=A0A840V1E8_9BACT|nr:PEP-CTERM sorting domain-containing protein [Desulfoprunum benzoelyticum]MBB5347529.1 hypothetical protein [Desulfoprunum benzoelyticum]
MKKRFLAALATGLLVVGMGGVAQALVLDGDGVPRIDDVIFTYLDAGGNSIPTFATKFTTYPGQFSGTGSITYFGQTFDYIVKDEAAPINNEFGVLDGIKFTLNADVGSVVGDFSLQWEESPAGNNKLPTYYDFLFTFKAGSGGSSGNSGDGTLLYFFDNIYLADPGSGLGLFDLSYNNRALSNMIVYGDPGDTPVPEPATMLLFGTGLAGLAGIARRRKKN